LLDVPLVHICGVHFHFVFPIRLLNCSYDLSNGSLRYSKDIFCIFTILFLYAIDAIHKRRTTMKPKLIHFSEEHAAVIKAAANSLGMTFTAFVRMAAIKEAEQS